MFTKLPPIVGHAVCSHGCGPHDCLDMEKMILVGFGNAGVQQDGSTVWDENMMGPDDDWDKAMTVQKAEDLAKTAPDSDWRIYFHAPLYDAVYQRQGDALWVLVEKGEGFA